MRTLAVFTSTLCLMMSLSGRPVQDPPKPTEEIPFGDEIRRYEEQDALRPPAKAGIVFVGSSSIARWKTLEKDFPQHRVLNRGFGGSQLSHSVAYAHRIVTPYEPQMVVLFAGTNDLADGKTPEEVHRDFRQFVWTVREKLPDVRIAYISITPAPSRWGRADAIRKANALIRRECLEGSNLAFIDVFSPMLDEFGQPRPDLFIEDRLHLNEKGYAIWRQAVAPYLPWGGSASLGVREWFARR